MKKIKIFECFAGIGAQHKALTNLKKLNKLDFEVVGISEWYISAIISYTLIHYNNEFHSFDISNISKQQMIDYLSQPHFSFSNDSKNPIKSLSKLKLETLQNLYKSCVISKNFGSILSIQGKSLPKDIDVLTYSFPCQDLSPAGKQNGMTKDSGTRSSLLWQIERILNEQKQLNSLPKSLLMENVKAILNKRNIDNLNIFLKKLENLGYTNYIYTLNSYDFGTPQKRERVFVYSTLNKKEVIFNFEKQEHIKIGEFFNLTSDYKNDLSFKKYKLNQSINNLNYMKEKRMALCSYDSFFTNTLTTKNKGRFPGAWIEYEDFYRCLTETEYLLLKNTIKSSEHIYKLGGNSIVVFVLEQLFKNIFENDFNKNI